MLALFLYAIGLLRLRVEDKSIIQIDTYLFVGYLTIQGTALSVEIIYLLVLLTIAHQDNALAAPILIGRLMHSIPSTYFQFRISGPLAYSKIYPSLISSPQMLKFSLWYGILLVLSFFEISFLRFLPWLSSTFSRAKLGYPDAEMHQSCLVIKLVQTLFTFFSQVCIVVTHCYIHKHESYFIHQKTEKTNQFTDPINLQW